MPLEILPQLERPHDRDPGFVRRLTRAVMERMRNALAGPKAMPGDPVDMAVLPHGVRQQLQHGERRLPSRAVSQLLNDDWRDAGVYLALKALRHDPQREALLLREVLLAMRRGSPRLEHVIRPFLDELPPDANVDAGKLNQLSLPGPNTYRRWTERVADDTLAAGRTPCLVMHSASLLLGAFATRMQAGTLLTVDPRRLPRPELPAGFTVSMDARDVRVTPWHLSHDLAAAAGGSVTIVDDRVNTGATLEEIKGTLAAAPGRMPAVGGERFVLDLRRPARA